MVNIRLRAIYRGAICDTTCHTDHFAGVDRLFRAGNSSNVRVDFVDEHECLPMAVYEWVSSTEPGVFVHLFGGICHRTNSTGNVCIVNNYRRSGKPSISVEALAKAAEVKITTGGGRSIGQRGCEQTLPVRI